MRTVNTEEVIALFFQRLGSQDASGIANLFAEEIDWYVPGNPALPWTGRRSGSGDVAIYFMTMWPRFAKGKSSAVMEQLLISGEDAVAFARFTHTVAQNGNTFETPVAMHLQVIQGKIVKMHLYEDSWVVSRAFFS